MIKLKIAPYGVINNNVCIKHGAKRKRCCVENCTNQAQNNNVCVKHGAKVEYPRCSFENCTKFAQKNNLCKRHGGKL